MTLGRDARARAIQLPAWNEALGLPRPWDQQWSLRIQQILANETDLLDYPDIFEGSKVMDGPRRRAGRGRPRRRWRSSTSTAARSRPSPYMKAQPRRVPPRADGEDRARRASRSIGQNCFTETEDSPLTAGADGGILTPDPEVERERREALERWKAERDQRGGRAGARASSPRPPRDESANIMPATIAAAKAGRDDRRVGGRAARGVRRLPGADRRRRRAPRAATGSCSPARRERVDEVSEQIGHRIRILVGKPGLDGHSNGAEQIAVRARDVGMEVDLPGDPPDARADRRLGARGGRRRGRPLDPLGLPPRAGPRDRPPAARGRRRRAGRSSAASSRRPTRRTARGRGRRASTRRRTSTSTGSWARSPSSSASGPRTAAPARLKTG